MSPYWTLGLPVAATADRDAIIQPGSSHVTTRHTLIPRENTDTLCTTDKRHEWDGRKKMQALIVAENRHNMGVSILTYLFKLLRHSVLLLLLTLSLISSTAQAGEHLYCERKTFV